jgi:hypothetical protein
MENQMKVEYKFDYTAIGEDQYYMSTDSNTYEAIAFLYNNLGKTFLKFQFVYLPLKINEEINCELKCLFVELDGLITSDLLVIKQREKMIFYKNELFIEGYIGRVICKQDRFDNFKLRIRGAITNKFLLENYKNDMWIIQS